MAEAALVAVILAVAAGLIIGGVAVSFVANSKNVINKEACRANVFAAAKDPTRTFQVNQCYTKEAGTLSKSDDPDNVILKNVADLVQECKYQFDDGSPDSMPWSRDFATESRICFVCSTFQPQRAVVKTALATWMENNVLGAKSYMEYVKPSLFLTDPNALFLSADRKSETVSALPYLYPEIPYSVISITHSDSTLSYAVGKTDMFIGTSDKSDARDYTHISIMKSSELGEFCDITFLRYP